MLTAPDTYTNLHNLNAANCISPHLKETHETIEYIDSIEQPVFSTFLRFGLNEFESHRPDHFLDLQWVQWFTTKLSLNRKNEC